MEKITIIIAFALLLLYGFKSMAKDEENEIF